MDCLHPYILRAGQMSNTIYTDSIALATHTDAAWRGLMYQLLRVNNNCSSLTASYITGTSIANKVVVKEITEGGKKYCVVHEKRAVCVQGVTTTTNRFKYGLGTLAALSATDSLTNVHIQATHPFADTWTQEQVVAVFFGVSARSLIIAGNHRDANTNGVNPCIGGTPVYGRTDPSHTKDWGFHQAVVGLRSYITEASCPLASCAVIQFHGKANSNCAPAQVFLSVGSDSHTTTVYPRSTVYPYYRIKQAIPSGWVAKDPVDDVVCKLTATKNVQGRLFNGVTPDVCGADATTFSHTFVHIEQNDEQRDPYDPANPYATWISVINTAF
jgi:hypothetical protein